MNNSPDSKTSAATALAAFLFLCALAALAIFLAQPPKAVPESAPPGVFSSGRAMRHVRAVAQRPHPTGTTEHARVRAYIIEELGKLGVKAEVQTTEVVPAPGDTDFPVPAARVQNIVARVPGAANTKALMLAAHYDSVPTGPGASDDGAGVATLLETVRALKSGPPPKNDIIVLVTDAEELGLLGARGFADEHPWMKDVGLVLNFEARGAGGPSLMFETSDGNGALISGLAAAPDVQANSLMYAVYKRLPNDTDMTVFKRAGAAGLNFAYADRITSYHTALDNPEELDERSLQHHGSYALALARHFGDAELNDLRSRDYVYFNALGPVFVRYSEAWVVPITFGVCVLFVAVVFAGLRKRRLSLGGMLAGLVAFLFAAALSALVTAGAWGAARRFIRGYDFLPWHRPYEVWPYEVGFVLLTLASFASVYALLFRKAGAANLLAGALLWWLAPLLLTTVLLPLGSFLFAWPLLFALAGLAYVIASGEGSAESSKGLSAVALSAAPGVCLVAPLVWLFFVMLGLDPAGFFMILVALVAGLFVPLFRAMTATRRWLFPLAAALAGVCLVAAAIFTSGFDAHRRKTDSVLYFLDADAGGARWVSTDARADEWTSQFIPDGPKQGSLSTVFPWAKQASREAWADTANLPAPDARVVEEKADDIKGTMTVRLRLLSQRGAPMLIFYVDTGAVTRAVLDGRTLFGGSDAGGAAGRTLRVSYAAPPPEGLELVLETRLNARLRLAVEDLSYGLPEIQGKAYRPRPDDLMPLPSYRASDTTVVRRAFELGAPPTD